MTFDATPAAQIISAFYSFLLGFILCVLYYILKIPLFVLIKLSDGRKYCELFVNVFTALCDIISACICAVVTVLFIYAANDGMTRYFMLLFELTGAFINRLTLGKLIKKLAIKTADLIYVVLVFIKNTAKMLLSPLIGYYRSKSYEKHILKIIGNS